MQSACAKCHRPILKRHRHLPEVDTLMPLLGMGECLFHSDRTSRSDVIREKAENKECANRHVPSAIYRFSIGTVIFPWSKNIE